MSDMSGMNSMRGKSRGNKENSKKQIVNISSGRFSNDDDDDEFKEEDSSMFGYLNSLFDVFGNSNDNNEDEDDNVVVKVDEGTMLSINEAFDNGDDSSVLVNQVICLKIYINIFYIIYII